jgi:hypothetical protein
MLNALHRWWNGLRKTAGYLVDGLKPKGKVELILRYAHGPKKGQVHRRIKGHNIVTGYINGTARPTTGNYDEYSGRDMMRRILVDPALDAGGLAGDVNYTVSQMILGSGTTAEASTDDALGTAIGGSTKAIASAEFHATQPYVTFVTEWDETEVNVTISEMALLSAAGTPDFIARKTISPFTKTNDFTLEVRWEIRF